MLELKSPIGENPVHGLCGLTVEKVMLVGKACSDIQALVTAGLSKCLGHHEKVAGHATKALSLDSLDEGSELSATDGYKAIHRQMLL